METKQKKKAPAGRTTSKTTTRQATTRQITTRQITTRQKTATRQRPATKQTATTRKPAGKEKPKVSADVVYLPPKPFNRSRLILRLATVVAVVLALVLGLSVFFKVDTVEVSGFDKYTRDEIVAASGIKAGDHLLTFGRTRAAGKIISALPYVKSVRIGIKLPDTVMIEVVEVDITYAVEAKDGNWWLMSAEGKIVEQAANGEESRYTKVLGIQLQDPQVGQQAVAWQNSTPPVDENGNAIPVTTTAAERLKAVINIAGFLETNKIIGKVATIDVNQLMDIKLWYGNQYQILLGGTDQLSVKIAMMKAALSQVDYDSGILDVRDPNNILFREFS